LLFAIFEKVESEGRESKVKKALEHQEEMFEGDIDLPDFGRNGIPPTKRWTNGVIAYEVADTFAGQWYKNMLAKAMKEIQDHTCIKFVPRTDEKNYVKIINGTGCTSHVGMSGGIQYLSLNDERDSSCWWHTIMIHEMLHAIGLWHEQSRPDRDQYVTINTDNVIDHLRHNFRLLSSSDTYGVPYNYLSGMHYDKTAFTKNGKVTIETKDKKYQDMIGQRETIVDSDYEKVRRIYKCSGSYPSRPSPTLPPCVDTITYCHQQLDKCGKEDWTKNYCRKSCGFC